MPAPMSSTVTSRCRRFLPRLASATGWKLITGSPSPRVPRRTQPGSASGPAARPSRDDQNVASRSGSTQSIVTPTQPVIIEPPVDFARSGLQHVAYEAVHDLGELVGILGPDPFGCCPAGCPHGPAGRGVGDDQQQPVGGDGRYFLQLRY